MSDDKRSPVDSMVREAAEVARTDPHAAYDMVLGPKVAAVEAEVDNAFKHELRVGLLNDLEAFFRGDVQAVFDKLFDLKEGTLQDGRFKYLLLRYKPLSMTDEDFAKQLTLRMQAWVRKVSLAAKDG